MLGELIEESDEVPEVSNDKVITIIIINNVVAQQVMWKYQHHVKLRKMECSDSVIGIEPWHKETNLSPQCESC